MKNLIILVVMSLISFGSMAQKKLIIQARAGGGGGTLLTIYKDADGDGFGDPYVNMQSEIILLGWVLNHLDCDDTNANITTGTVWYGDNDGDGFGDPNVTLTSCNQPAGFVSNNLDTCPTVYGTNNGCPATGLNTHSFGNYNYIYEEILQGEATESTYNNVADNSKIRNITYFDGLGRKVQSRAIAQSPTGKDIVVHYDYDSLGRQAKAYLPYASAYGDGLFQADALSKTNAYYNKPTYGNTTNPYSEKVFDGSPLNRVLETGAPGVAWLANPSSDNDHTVKMGFATNSATDNLHKVRQYNVTLDANYTPTLTNPSPYYYPVASLFKTVIKDENWTPTSGKLNTTEEFKNKFGQTLLKRTYALVSSIETPHDTYYVYDNYNNLTFVMPPKVVTSDGISTNELNELCYQYKYDKYNRLIEKKIPGKGWEYIVYNKMDKPILSQDALQNAKNPKEWLFTKYDAFGRVVYTGLYKDSSNGSRSAVQAAADANSATSESRGTALYNYTNTAFPTAIAANDVYTLSYYDDYNFDTDGLTVPSSVYGVTPTSNTQALTTGTKVRVLGTTNWITTISGFDAKARPIYVASKNQFLNTANTVQTKLDFTGKVAETTSTHTSNTTVTLVDTFTYDNAGRLLSQKQKINSQAQEVIVENTYDALGKLISKGVGGKTTEARLQNVDFTYNIRGWLTGINDVNNLGGDLFSFALSYNDVKDDIYSQVKPLYNGNISETYWKTANDNYLRGYGYRYDALNRLKDAWYEEPTNSGGKYPGFYETRLITYDKNGNINYLRRSGKENNTFVIMDRLYYTYQNNSNKLMAVAQGADATQGGFTDGNTVGDDYVYDANGNMTVDKNKGITAVSYNHLNLPTKVSFGATKNITYVYDALGIKLEKVVNDNGTITTTDYAGGFIYENNQLQFFSQPEGFVVANASSFNYVYQYKDHLGNIRLNYGKNTTTGVLEIKEENNYYPFGLKHKGYNSNVIKEHKYKYNGKELQQELGLNMYDYGARNYDPALGRWMNIDPLASSPMQLDKSPFAYTWNNPINLTDPDGRHPDWNDNPITIYGVNGQVIATIGGSNPTPFTRNRRENKKAKRPKWTSGYGFKVHQKANKNGYFRGRKLSKEEKKRRRKIVKILNDATVFADGTEFQTGEFSFRHGMRNSGQSINEARGLANSFVKAQFIRAKELFNSGKIDKAYFQFGIGLHTLQDATSPAHGGFQVWNGNETISQIYRHLNQELIYPGIDSNLQRITNIFIDWFESTSQTLPTSNFFNDIQTD